MENFRQAPVNKPTSKQMPSIRIPCPIINMANPKMPHISMQQSIGRSILIKNRNSGMLVTSAILQVETTMKAGM